MIDILPGTWYILFSNFAMWKHKGVINPTFNYTLAIKDGEKILLDEVRSVKHDIQKTIKGFNFQGKEDAAQFIWRGKGWLMLFTCKWKVEWLNADNTCAIISFQKTWVTPAGVDIISRHKFVAESVIQEAKTELRQLTHLANIAENLFEVVRK